MSRGQQRTRHRKLLLAGVAVLLLGVFALVSGCGRTIRVETMTGHTADFDFRSFDCNAARSEDASVSNSSSTPSDLLVRYLGVSGVYFEWQGVGLLSAPFFSHQGLLRVAAGKGRINEEAIRDGMAGVPEARAAAILVGHAHHDHLLDVPQVAQMHPDAVVYANQSGVNLLAAEQNLVGRTRALNDQVGSWIQLKDEEGRPLPIRFMALASPHAKQGPVFRWATGSLETPATRELRDLPLRSFKGGKPLAFVVDFLPVQDTALVPGDESGLDGETDLDAEKGLNLEPVVRVYLQDAATEGVGLAPTMHYPQLADHPIDLAVLCIASHNLAEGFPEELLSDLEPRHVLVSHYRDFFRSPHKPIRFTPMLTNRSANGFLNRIAAHVEGLDREPLDWAEPSCGPSASSWTMPVPGELLRLETQQ